jgi:hypothetical protein
MDDADARDLLLARRLKLGIRLVVYPLLLGLLAVAWHARSARGDGEQGGSAWSGTTAQGLSVRAAIDGKWLESLTLPVTLRCDQGSTYRFTWTPSQDVLRQQGHAVTAHRPPTTRPGAAGRSGTYEARLRMVTGDHPHGTASLVETWTWTDQPRGSRTVCRSGPVAFTLRHGATT